MRTFFTLFLFSVLGFFFSQPSAIASCPLTNTTNFAVYTGTGVDALSKYWVRYFMNDWSVNYASLSTAEFNSCDFTRYPNLKAIVMPGGNAYSRQAALGSTGKNKIYAFLNSGGKYVGICAGWFYASNGYYWEGTWYNYANLLKYIQAPEGSISALATYPNLAIASVNGGSGKMLYWGGPTYGYYYTRYPGPGSEKLKYTDYWTYGLKAGLSYYKMLLFSVHPEAKENHGFTGLTASQRQSNYLFLRSKINAHLGTNY